MSSKRRAQLRNSDAALEVASDSDTTDTSVSSDGPGRGKRARAAKRKCQPRTNRSQNTEEEAKIKGDDGPAKKTKTEKPLSPYDRDREIVLEYIAKNNKPFNVNEASLSLQTVIGTKSNIPKILAGLVKEDKLIEKSCGKARMYAPKRDRATPEEIEKITREVEEMAAELEALKENVGGVKQEYDELRKEPSDIDLFEQNDVLSQEVAQKLERLSEFKLSAPRPIDPAQKDKIIQKTALMLKEKKRRKKMFNDIVLQIMEGTGLSKKGLMSKAGIESPLPE